MTCKEVDWMSHLRSHNEVEVFTKVLGLSPDEIEDRDSDERAG